MTATNWKSCLALLFAGALASTGCGSSGSNPPPPPPPDPGTGNPPGVTKGLAVEVTGVTEASSGIQVRFTLKDDLGYPVDVNGVYSVNTPVKLAFSLSYLTRDDQGQELPLTVLTRASSTYDVATVSPSAFNPLGNPAQGTLTENAAGDYTYTFPNADSTAPNGVQTRAVAYDSTKRSSTHVVWVQATRQTDLDDPNDVVTFTAKNAAYYYVPAGGSTTETREIVKASNCSNCHAGFKPEDMASAFHGGGRVDGTYCEVCHNPGRTSNPAADGMVFVHRIHSSEDLTRVTTGTVTVGTQIGGNTDGTDKSCSVSKPCTCTDANPCVPNAFHGIVDVTYPQDLRNCQGCHGGAAQGDQWKTRPSRAACGSCHDSVDFATGNNHAGGVATTDAGCNVSGCHTPDKIASVHLPIVEPDPNSTYAGGTNQRTNAAYLVGAGALPAGAAKLSYDIKSVARNSSGQPVIVFRIMKTEGSATTPVVSPTACTTTATATQELMPGFVGGPSVYFVYALPQDNITKPADFNVAINAYTRNLCNGTAASSGTMTGPDADGYYTVTLTATSSNIPTSAVMLTGGVGYNYDLSSVQPLTEIDLPDYPYGADASHPQVGGLIVPVTNVWKTATGYTARRAIVDNDRCNSCHAGLGVSPTFHVGQRNDGESCAFCHNPNKVSSGWSINAKDFIHSLHAARVRTVPFGYGASATDSGWADVTFPSRLNNCEACHLPGTYDFSAAASAAAVPNLLPSTEAVNASSEPSSYARSPYLGTTTLASLGTGFSTSGSCSVAAPCQPQGNTLVTTPVMAACVRCHDADEAVAHMKWGGGSFYATRTALLTAAPEQCLLCHGQGKIADISEMHMGK